MTETFLKKYWDEENITFYLHFENDIAVRQIEVSPRGKVKISQDKDSMLYDQKLSDLDQETFETISKSDFEIEWNQND